MRFPSFLRSGDPSFWIALLAWAVVLNPAWRPSAQAHPPEERPGVSHATPRPQSDLPKAEIIVNHSTFQVEVASTAAETQKGLMHRTFLPKRHGMLFLFRPAQTVQFWMKDTLIPLDMVFISHWRISRVYRDVPPCRQSACETYGSVEPVDMVMELPAGSVERDKIRPGAPVELRRRGKGARLILGDDSGSRNRRAYDHASDPNER